MHIDFLVGKNPYDSTAHFSKKFAEALERKGVKTRLFSVGKGNFYKAFYAILENPPDLTCSFSDITVGEGMPLGDQWHIPHLSFLIDPAIYYLHQLKGKYSVLSCVDREDVAFVKGLDFSRVFFFPHGVEQEIKGEAERPFDVVFFGTLQDYEKIRARWAPDSPLHAAAERVLSPEGVSCKRALLEAGVKEDFPLLHHELDMYVTSKDRVELIRALRGMDVHVWGKGPWKRYCSQATVHPPLPFVKTLDIMKRAKIVLNSSPRFKEGSHERLFYGLGSGALVITGANPYVSEHLPGLPLYHYGNWEEIKESVPHFLEKGQELRRELREHVLHHHTWDHRAEEFLLRSEQFGHWLMDSPVLPKKG